MTVELIMPFVESLRQKDVMADEIPRNTNYYAYLQLQLHRIVEGGCNQANHHSPLLKDGCI
jgi:hypothetical protein